MRCSYHDDTKSHNESVVGEDLASIISAKSTEPYVKWSGEIRYEVRQWRKSGIIPPLTCLAPNFHLPTTIYSEDELCYVYHLMKLYHKLEASGLCHLTILSTFMPRFDVLLEVDLIQLC